jgi:hypothetical protein
MIYQFAIAAVGYTIVLALNYSHYIYLKVIYLLLFRPINLGREGGATPLCHDVVHIGFHKSQTPLTLITKIISRSTIPNMYHLRIYFMIKSNDVD